MGLLAVGLGGALGTGLRVALSLLALHLLAEHAYLATLVANVLGAGLVGYLATRSLSVGRRAFWMTGFCGGFTTFSLFSLEVVMLLDHTIIGALAYGSASLVLWMLAVRAGWRWGQA